MINEKVYKMEFSKIYPLLVNKAVRKGRTKDEVDEIIRWLTGYSQTELEEMLDTAINCGLQVTARQSWKRCLIQRSIMKIFSAMLRN